MNGKKAKKLRRQAEAQTTGLPKKKYEVTTINYVRKDGTVSGSAQTARLSRESTRGVYKLSKNGQGLGEGKSG